ncbi:protocatechuate 3,4-dioxygenase subunit beta [Arvimicrobium flavum]|uniref:protocatechuate 3,4-dioxygenase subunit beta n=1 Tax=Arvimicrobium flavum TaxID=3393320 RepID=UPI00237B97EC|nr:protocatechuate 3,4-dioxygenase subunit beta [Mesorhizobium shangrilense]
MTAGASDRDEQPGVFLPRDRSVHPPALTPGYRSTMLRSPRQPLLSLGGTLSEMTGPVFGHSILGDLDGDLTRNFARPGESTIGERIIVHGRVLDEDGRPVPSALLEVWQANAGGRYRHKREGYLAPLDPNFGGCGRVITAEDGSYTFRTIKPGPYPWPNGPNDWRPAHIHFSVFGHGFAQRLITQMYFEGDPLIWRCPIVASIPDKSAIERLVALLDMDNTVPFDARAYRFDIVLRGRGSTLFENRLEGN